MHVNLDLLGKVLRLLEGTQRDAVLLRQEIGALRQTVEHQAAEIARMQDESARQARDQNFLFAYVQDEFARVLLWLGALAGKVLPQAAGIANEVAAKLGWPAETIPPERLTGRTGARKG